MYPPECAKPTLGDSRKVLPMDKADASGRQFSAKQVHQKGKHPRQTQKSAPLRVQTRRVDFVTRVGVHFKGVAFIGNLRV